MLNSYCEYRYYNEYDSSVLLNDLQKNVEPSISTLNKEFLYIFYKLINTEPCSYWNNDVYKETYSQLEKLYQTNASTLNIDENIFNYFIMGYNAYCQISETIVDLSNFNLTQEIKTRLYRLPTYTAILESCLSNFLRVIATLTGQSLGKDYSSQNTLGKLVNVINSNGYNQIGSNIDVNIRNAINHGKVLFKKDPVDKLCFYYSEQGVSKSMEVTFFDFDKMIETMVESVKNSCHQMKIFYVLLIIMHLVPQH